MINLFILILIFGFWYSTRFISDTTSAVESFQSNETFEEINIESQGEVSKKSECQKIKLINMFLMKKFIQVGGRRSLRVNSTYISSQKDRYKTALASFVPFRRHNTSV